MTERKSKKNSNVKLRWKSNNKISIYGLWNNSSLARHFKFIFIILNEWMNEWFIERLTKKKLFDFIQ